MRTFSLAVLLLGGALLPLMSAAGAADAVVVNRVAATVNGRPITSSEVRAGLAPTIRELLVLYPRQGSQFNAELIKAKKAVIDELIDRELVLSDFESRGYVMKAKFVDDEINRRILMHFNGDRDAFLDMLRKSGMNLHEYRQKVLKDVTVESMRAQKYDRGIPPTPAEIREEYARSGSDLRDITKDRIVYEKILLPVEDPGVCGVSVDGQFAKAQELQKDIVSGKVSFADAAREHSADARASEGGRWPEMQRSDLAPDFAGVVFNAPEGKVIGPLLDPHGFTIVRVVRKRLAPAPSLSNPDVKRQIEDAVRRRKSEQRYREWVERLRDRAVIHVFI